ncbi:MAG: clan AA aspartic protease [Akkermansiaceae bacterium]|nr:clan AA aspartic protease [Armatimonadota bacterium]
MIVGELSASREMIVPIAVRGGAGDEVTIRAVLDTGFGAYLTLTPEVINDLSLDVTGIVNVMLGDGSSTTLLKYAVEVVWDGQSRTVPVYEAEGDPLIGMMLLYGFDFHVHVVDGGMVALNPLP